MNVSPRRSLSLPCQLQSQRNLLYWLKVSYYYYLRQDLMWSRLASNSLYRKDDPEPLSCSPFWERVSLCNPGYLGICYIDQVVLESRDPPVPLQHHPSSMGVKGMHQHTQPTLELMRGGKTSGSEWWDFKYLPHTPFMSSGVLQLQNSYMCADKSQDFRFKKLRCIARCTDIHL